MTPNLWVLVCLIGVLTPLIGLSLWSAFSYDFTRLFLRAAVSGVLC